MALISRRKGNAPLAISGLAFSEVELDAFSKDGNDGGAGGAGGAGGVCAILLVLSEPEKLDGVLLLGKGGAIPGKGGGAGGGASEVSGFSFANDGFCPRLGGNVEGGGGGIDGALVGGAGDLAECFRAIDVDTDGGADGIGGAFCEFPLFCWLALGAAELLVVALDLTPSTTLDSSRLAFI